MYQQPDIRYTPLLMYHRIDDSNVIACMIYAGVVENLWHRTVLLVSCLVLALD